MAKDPSCEDASKRAAWLKSFEMYTVGSTLGGQQQQQQELQENKTRDRPRGCLSIVSKPKAGAKHRVQDAGHGHDIYLRLAVRKNI